MDESILEEMKEKSSKKEAMIPRTVRFGREIDKDLQDFADSNGLEFSVVVRTMVILGWKEFNNR